MRDPKEKCEVTWENRYGTTVSGNLPQYNVGECVEDVVDLPAIWAGGATWVTVRDFHFYHIKCPYGIYTVSGADPAAMNYVRNVIPSSPNYWHMEQVLPADRSAHNATAGMMIRYTVGARKHGWLCVDPNCKYFLDTGKRYFYF